MKLHLLQANPTGETHISGSKSESNRWLILQKLFPEIQQIENLSHAEDTVLLQKALQSDAPVIDIHHAGTAMRFLTAYFALCTEKEVMLTGSSRMKERPIYPLVEALQSIGANITYTEKEGFPPLLIKGQKTAVSSIEIDANISSQYITALMLIAPTLPQGLEIHFRTALTSRPYIEMTKAQLESMGIQVEWLENGIRVSPKKEINPMTAVVESDWSSASYWYSWVALSHQSELTLHTFKKDSLQGDSALVKIYGTYFGVETIWGEDFIQLKKKKNFKYPDSITLDLGSTPDIAQTIAVTCAGLKIKATFTGLHTLKIKETDRLSALHNELKKVGVTTQITEDSLSIFSFEEAHDCPTIDTYQDHRMAMCFAPLALKQDLYIQNPDVVVKSYPQFWNDLRSVSTTKI